VVEEGWAGLLRTAGPRVRELSQLIDDAAAATERLQGVAREEGERASQGVSAIAEAVALARRAAGTNRVLPRLPCSSIGAAATRAAETVRAAAAEVPAGSCPSTCSTRRRGCSPSSR
jgi:hypothetical protein